MALMTKDEILRVDDRGHEDVPVPGWGTVRLRILSAAERAEIEKRFSDQAALARDPGGFRGQVLVRTIVGEDGEPLFTPADTAALLAKGTPAIEYLFDHACKLNSLTQGAIEELEKNLPSGRNGDSPSG